MDKVNSLLTSINTYLLDKHKAYERTINHLTNTTFSIEYTSLLNTFLLLQQAYDSLFDLFPFSLNNNSNNSHINLYSHLPQLTIKFEKQLQHNHNGMWFHPRELIEDKMIITSGHNGIVKTWTIPQLTFHKEINTHSQWVTSIKYDPHLKLIFIGSYSEYLQIYKYSNKDNDISLIDQVKLNLLIIYGIDAKNGLLACGGCSESKSNITLYTYSYDEDIDNFDIEFNQLIQPFKKVSLNSIERKEEGYSKSLRFSIDLTMLFAGYSNGLIETYAVDVLNHSSTMLHYLILDKADFVYQMQIVNDNKLYVTNGNLLYLLAYDQFELKVIKKKKFFSSINDFCCFNSNAKANNNDSDVLGIKLKTGNILFYLPIEDRVINEIDESVNRGLYDNCLLIHNTSKHQLVISGKDNDLMVYSFTLI